ncbi:MAG: 4Fe-4S binding protein [Anaerolineae bacterium]|nr:4Fe-4S binding protein [Anaerolineae bacterium]
MIAVDLAKCTGCGACADVCPRGAVQIVAGHAEIDDARCERCAACVPACPEGALAEVAAPVAVVQERLPGPRPQAVIDVSPPRTPPVPWRQKVLPALGAVASYAAREVLPRVLEIVASWPSRPEVGQRGEVSPGAQRPAGSGRQHRHRRRGQ